MNKPYELTPKEMDGVWQNNRRIQSHMTYDMAIGYAAQKKLMEFLLKEGHLIDAGNILAEFGIGV